MEEITVSYALRIEPSYIHTVCLHMYMYAAILTVENVQGGMWSPLWGGVATWCANPVTVLSRSFEL